MNANTDIRELAGVGPKTAALFDKLGIHVIGDLLDYYPREYSVYKPPVPIAELKEGYVLTVRARFIRKLSLRRNGRFQILTGKVRDDSGILDVTWFNMPYLKNTIHYDEAIILRAKIKSRGKGFVMEQPEIYTDTSYSDRLSSTQPVYSLTAGLTNNMISKMARASLELIQKEEEFLPEEVFRTISLMPHDEAVREIHFPMSEASLERARQRLAFEEFFFFTLTLRQAKASRVKDRNQYTFRQDSYVSKLLESLPFHLTGAQCRVWDEIKSDLRGENVMSRLIQGDVGSGKTIVAVMAMLFAAENGYQAAIMAPTEVLAAQHFSVIQRLVAKAGIQVETAILTGSMKAAAKRDARERIESGQARLIVGTHALLQDKVKYKKLALVITDEQHRFGVRQRETLNAKGVSPHILVMSATPIPRTLALILYGDLDISLMNELPANRLPIKNCQVGLSYRKTAYHFIEEQVRTGRQAYVICPMIEENEDVDGESVIGYSKKLRTIFPDTIRVECLHGKMKQTEKDAVMTAFGEGSVQVLVSTTVVEVGVDVPNATIMMVENAERFGLSTLHQLRGRVGRGEYQSYCIFISGSDVPETKERLQILCDSNDGFYIAEQDLRLRGPGELCGLRQSGEEGFKAGSIYRDAEILKKARDAAELILKEDPELSSSKFSGARRQLERYGKIQFSI